MSSLLGATRRPVLRALALGSLALAAGARGAGDRGAPGGAGDHPVLEALGGLMPGTPVGDLERAHGPGAAVRDWAADAGPGGDAGGPVRRYGVSAPPWRLHAWVRVRGGAARDLFARLPSSVPHDPLHAALIARHGRQDRYLLTNGTAVYGWGPKEGRPSVTYAAQCTITCFPLWLSVTSAAAPAAAPRGPAGGPASLLESLEARLP